jgi:CheY-like chemotaxis protein/tRNA A-37 threonylcarbamoyl transferase component Bud32
MQSDQTRASTSLEEFIRNLEDSGLFSPAELGQVLGPSVFEGGSALALIRQLMAAGKLTAFQAEAVLERRFAELRVGNYDVMERLGAGGMGTVYKARHRRMKRVVALKVLSRDVAEAPAFVARFQREVETIAQLSHPNIVMAFDADEAEAGHFLVMEFVDGRDLAHEVQNNGPLSVSGAIDTVVQAARGLEYAHGRGLVHRDVKPANLLRDQTGVVKVADLGLARFSSRGQEGNSSVTQAGSIVGTLDFISPEQALDSANVDHRADVYSLGCTLFYLLTGQPPYRGDNFMALLLQHKVGAIPSLCAFRPDAPAELDAVFRKMLAKERDERYPSMTEVIGALEHVKKVVDSAPPRIVLAMPGEKCPDPTGDTLAVGPRHLEMVQKQLQKAAPVPEPAGGLDALRIVVVEPSRTQAGIIRKYLQELGVREVHAAGSGVEAVALAGKVRPQVVLSAMHLPDMTGAELAKALAAAPGCAGVGLILITSEAVAGVDRAVLLYKPFDQQQLARSLAVATGQAGQRPTEQVRVLIADDSPAARAHIRAVLRGLGFENCSEVKDGTAAVELLQKERFDLVVSDYSMPGLNGRDLVRFIRQQSSMPAVPVLMVTAETDPDVREGLRQAGVSAICEKSFKPEVVRALLDRLL